MRAIYLDHNATTTLLPGVWEAMRSTPTGNPSSAHAAGRKARQALEDARETIAALLGALPEEVIFTSGATEANNHAVLGWSSQPNPPTPFPAREGGAESPSPRGGGVGEGLLSNLTPQPPSLRGKGEQNPSPRGGGVGEGSSPPPVAHAPGSPDVIASLLEHPCVIEPLRHLESRGAQVEWWGVDRRGVISLAPVPPDTRLVCLMLANHETGAIQPVRDVARALPPGVALHCDAAQAVGKIPVNFRELGVTTLSATAHKFGGPMGVGVLVVKRGTNLPPLLFGGHQQGGRRPGTEPVALAVGMATALTIATRTMTAHHAKLTTLRARLWERLQEVAAPVVLNGPEIGALDVVPTTLNVSFPGCRADLLLMALDLAGVACSTGSACSSGSLLPSPVLRAMSVPDEVLRSAMRFSFCASLEIADIDEAADRIGETVRHIRESGKMG